MKDIGSSPLAYAEKQDIYGRTALHYAALEGHRDILKLILDVGARCDVMDNEGQVTCRFIHSS